MAKTAKKAIAPTILAGLSVAAARAVSDIRAEFTSQKSTEGDFEGGAGAEFPESSIREILQENGKNKNKEKVLFMPTGIASFNKRLQMIDRAKSSVRVILFQSYGDFGSLLFYSTLLRAAERGVDVRIVLDGKIGRLRGSLRTIEKILCNHKNIHFYYFNELCLFCPSAAAVVLHDKIMTVDGREMIIGGANMGFNSYLENRDTEVFLCGRGENCTAKRANAYFDELASSNLTAIKHCESCDTAKKAEYISLAAAYLASINEEITDGYVPADSVVLLNNPINDGKKTPVIFDAIAELASKASKSEFLTPYILLDEEKKGVLSDIAQNSELEIVTNSLFNTHNIAFPEYLSARKEYAKSGIKLYELQTPRQSHAKLYLFDEEIAAIGSFNLDERSAHIDTESVVIIRSRELCGKIAGYMSEEKKRSLRVTEDDCYEGRPGVAERAVPTYKRIYSLCRPALRPFINLL